MSRLRTGIALALSSALALVGTLLLPSASSATLVERAGYAAHVQTIGWQSTRYDGATAGTTGKALRLEAFRVSSPSLTYRAWVQGYGWQAWTSTGAVAGTVGRSLRLEGFQVTAPSAASYRVEYRAHVQKLGWLPWVHDGATAGTPGQGLRVEAMQVRLVEKNPPVTDPVTVAVTADNGLASNAQGVFYGIGKSGAQLSFVLGDLAYEPYKEAAYCSMVTSRVNAPVVLLTGNHEDDTTHQGYLKNYVKCLPDRLAVTGSYAKDYVLDRGAVRFIMIAPNILINGVQKTYANGTPEQAWLRTQIRDGHAAGRWVVVGMHKPCLTLGLHGCASSPDLTNALIAEKVDLSLAGHDHNYIRSNQLAGTVASPTVVDNDGAFAAGRGTVFTIVGNGGHEARTVAEKTALWAATSGSNSSGGLTVGFGKITATPTGLTFQLVRTSGGTLSDSFTITR